MRCALILYVCNCPLLVFTQVAQFQQFVIMLITQTLARLLPNTKNGTDAEAMTKPMAKDSWPVPGRKLGNGAFGVVLEGKMADGRKVCTTWLMVTCMHTVDTRTHACTHSHKDIYGFTS